MSPTEETWEAEYFAISERNLVGAMRRANHIRIDQTASPHHRTQMANRIEQLRESVRRFHQEVPKYWSHELAALRQA